MIKFSSGLLNYVESVNYNGVLKTAFYTDFATNFNIGDKVYIVNGNYDSDILIQNSNFTEGIDGYKVLDVDRCRIVLDIDFTGIFPYSEDSIDNYINVYHITSQQEFDYINNIQINTYPNNIFNKFEYGVTNNIIYADAGFAGTLEISSFTAAGTLFNDYYGLVNGPGFYQKNSNSNAWIYYSTPLTATSSIYFNTSGPGTTYSLTNNGKLFIIGEDIVIGNQTFKQRGIYAFDKIKNTWNYDILSNKPYISKLNFRNGVFKGVWNDGIFGSYKNEVNWNNKSGKWFSGIFINSNWKSGTISDKTLQIIEQNAYINTSLYNAKFSVQEGKTTEILRINSTTASRTISYNSINNSSTNNVTQNYYATLDSNKLPLQSTDFSNNKGFGFNYIIDSNIETSEILNGSFINCNVGLTNYGVNSLDVYYGETFTYSISASNGYFNFCDINTTVLKDVYVNDSSIENSNIIKSRISSSQISNSIINGTYNSNNGITVISADLWSYYFKNKIRGIIKLFISDSDLLRLSNFEVIYIDRINKEIYLSNFDEEKRAYINLENKYIFDYIDNSELSTDKIIISRKNKIDNKYKTSVSYNGSLYTNNYTLNANNY